MRILLDSSFLLTLATKPIKRIELLQGARYVVLSAVIHELNSLASSKSVKRAKAAREALNLINNINAEIIDIKGKPIDDLIIKYAIENNLYVATLDSHIKQVLRSKGIGVITLSNDKIVIES